MSVNVAVLQLPGVNGEEEAARALERVGLAAEIVPWTIPKNRFENYSAYVLPGGFSFQDRVRAGAVAARLSLLEVICRQAAKGVPVLGICNGAQILVESGLVPGDGKLSLALAPNLTPGREGYLARWISCEVTASPCLFTQAYAPGEQVPFPVAHAEGRFVSSVSQAWDDWHARGQIPLHYTVPAWQAGGVPKTRSKTSVPFPWNPNGAQRDVAAFCNRQGNVLALMPHPERAESLAQVPVDLPGPWGERRRGVGGGSKLLSSAGPGRGIFLSLAWELLGKPRARGNQTGIVKSVGASR